MNSGPDWMAGTRQLQQSLEEGWQKAMETFAGGKPVHAFAGLGEATNAPPLLPQLTFAPDKLAALQQAYLKEAAELWNHGLLGVTSRDKRFANEAWGANPVSAFTAASYLLNGRTLLALVEAADTDVKTKARLRFAVEQWMAASAPSNFLVLNAEAQKKAIETRGESIARGMQNLLADIQQGHVSMTDESQFEVGRNVATTEGAVVFENELIQLIEYKPSTAKVYERPFLVVPPCINKFYILDLQPDNSFVRHAVSQGHRVFLVSWVNASEAVQTKTWDDYIEHGVIRAIEEVQAIGRQDKINVLGLYSISWMSSFSKTTAPSVVATLRPTSNWLSSVCDTWPCWMSCHRCFRPWAIDSPFVSSALRCASGLRAR